MKRQSPIAASVRLLLRVLPVVFLMLLLLAASLAAPPPKADAHSNTFVYTDIYIERQSVKMIMRVDNLTIWEIGGSMDLNQDKIIDSSELETGYASVLEPYLAKTLSVKNGGATLEMESVKQDLPNPNVIRMELTFPAGRQLQTIGIRYDSFFEVAAGHQNIAVFHQPNGTTFQHILDAGKREWVGEYGGQAPSVLETMREFVMLGIEHILTGYDHLLFLLALLIVGMSFKQMLGVVSSFTIAHSITLALSALDVVSLPSRLVESVIALSIVYVVYENVYRAQNVKYRWMLTFGFGLIHGFGFAGALQEIGLPKQQEVYALFTFNLGVELGQLAIVCIVLPLLLYIKKRQWFGRLRLSASAMIGLAGSFWFITRVFGL